jgi:predicted short-subunit dehydrogenase-like oxidoreductase (DUF2520 family)
MKPAFAILGAGRLGSALGRVLLRSGLRPAGISCRTMRSARRAVRFIRGGLPATSNARAATGAGLVLICTPDRAVAEVASDLSGTPELRLRGVVVAHTSGALASTLLQPVAARGALVASLHPLASIADPRGGLLRLRGIPFAVEGDPRAVRFLRRLVAGLGGVPVAIPREAKALYHLIAVLLSNDLVAYLDLGLMAAGGLGLSRREAARLYLPLVRGTLENVSRLGPARALTGPVSRGDLATLRLHGEALRALPADLRRLHRMLGQRSATLALEAGTITPETAARLSRILSTLP